MLDTMTADRALIDVAHEVVKNSATGTVFGTPVTQDGVTILPVARVTAWGGIEAGDPPVAGIAVPDGGVARPVGAIHATAKPLGALVIAGGKVSWQPTVDVNKVILGGQLVGVVALLTMRALASLRSRRPTGRRNRRPGLARRFRPARRCARW